MIAASTALGILFLALGIEATEPAPTAVDAAAARASQELSKIAETMRAAPALSPDERLERAAAVAGVIRPLPVSAAILTTVVGFTLLLFGQRLLMIGTVIYLAALVGLAGREFGARIGDGWQSLIGGGVGCILGAGLAVPLRATARWVIGGLAGGILAAMLMQCFTSSLPVTGLAGLGGCVVSGALTLYFPKPLLIVGFSMFGAAAASIGILSIATESIGGRIPYGAAHITGMLLAAALGVLFQSQLSGSETVDESE